MGEAFMSYHPDPLVREYEDRGMAKWMGFYLSEHTSEMEKEKLVRGKIWQRRSLMSEIEISETLEEAFNNKNEVNIQLNSLNVEGQAYEDIIGVVEGVNGTSLFLSTQNQGIQIIPNGAIHNVQLVKNSKWSDLQ